MKTDGHVCVRARVRACARVFELTYSDNVGHPAGVLDPHETRHQRGPVFPERGPGRQPRVPHGRKVADPLFCLKFQRLLRFAHQH